VFAKIGYVSRSKLTGYIRFAQLCAVRYCVFPDQDWSVLGFDKMERVWLSDILTALLEHLLFLEKVSQRKWRNQMSDACSIIIGTWRKNIIKFFCFSLLKFENLPNTGFWPSAN
jgi:hypothetical protein